MVEGRQFLPLRSHAARISQVLSLREDALDWEVVCDWLNLASTVNSVLLRGVSQSASYGWCSAADEFNESRDELLSRFVFQHLLFSLIWSALEAALTIVRLPKHPDKAKRGKIRNAALFLDRTFSGRERVWGLGQELELFRESAVACLGPKAVNRRLALRDEFSEAGIGLYLVYELRNQFAHGAFELPEPDCENRPVSAHESMISHASRLVLIQMQMLFLARLQPEDEPVSFGRALGASSEEVPLCIALRDCHVQRLGPAGGQRF